MARHKDGGDWRMEANMFRWGLFWFCDVRKSVQNVVSASRKDGKIITSSVFGNQLRVGCRGQEQRQRRRGGTKPRDIYFLAHHNRAQPSPPHHPYDMLPVLLDDHHPPLGSRGAVAMTSSAKRAWVATLKQASNATQSQLSPMSCPFLSPAPRRRGVITAWLEERMRRGRPRSSSWGVEVLWDDWWI